MSNVLSKYWYPEDVNNKSLETKNVEDISGAFSYLFILGYGLYIAWKISEYIPFEF